MRMLSHLKIREMERLGTMREGFLQPNEDHLLEHKGLQ